MIQPKIYTDLIVMEGSVLTDVPLDQILDTHVLSKSSFTVLSKEFDMKKTSKGPKLADVEGQDIFGLTSWTETQLRNGGSSLYQYNRVVYRTDKSTSDGGPLNIKTSLLKK